MSKRMIDEDVSLNKTLTKEVLSRFDFFQLLFYAISMYCGGPLTEIFDKRKVLAAAYIGFAIGTLL